MKNREKYTNTDDALKAYAEHNKRCKCGCTFEQWLDLDVSERYLLNSAEITDLIVGMMTINGLLSKHGKDRGSRTDRPSDGDEVLGAECPICHGRHGKIAKNTLEPCFTCPDCRVFIAKDGINPSMTVAEFRAFLANLASRNSKKD